MKLAEQEIINILIEFIRTNYLDEEDSHLLTPESDLFEEGFIDSLGFERFVLFIENKYKITFNESYFFDPRFASIKGLVKIIFEIRNRKN